MRALSEDVKYLKHRLGKALKAHGKKWSKAYKAGMSGGELDSYCYDGHKLSQAMKLVEEVAKMVDRFESLKIK